MQNFNLSLGEGTGAPKYMAVRVEVLLQIFQQTDYGVVAAHILHYAADPITPGVPIYLRVSEEVGKASWKQ